MNNNIVFPVDRKYRVTQTFKDHLARPGQYNGGLDIATPVGTDVVSPADGYIDQTGYAPSGYGNYIVIRHTGLDRWSKLGHLSEIGVEVGQKIAMGQLVGKTGNTGNSSGPHLHFEWCKPSGKFTPIDPAPEFGIDLPEYLSKAVPKASGEKKQKRNE